MPSTTADDASTSAGKRGLQPGTFTQEKKVKKKEAVENKIVKKAVEEAQSDAALQGQMSNIASQQQDQLDNIDQVLGAA